MIQEVESSEKSTKTNQFAADLYLTRNSTVKWQQAIKKSANSFYETEHNFNTQT